MDNAAALNLHRADRVAGIFSSTQVIAWRVLAKFLRSPQLVVVGTVQSAIFLLIFRYMFGGAISIHGFSYVDFLVPGFVTTGVLFSGMMAAAGMAEDMQAGFVSRLRSLPIPRAAVLTGRALADTAIVLWGVAISVAIAFLVGFQLHASPASALSAVGLIAVFGFVFEWFFIALGMLAGSPQAAHGLTLVVFPFTFISSAYIPVDTMPSWMQVFARNQPLTPMVDAVRALTQGHAAEVLLGHGAEYYVVRALVWAAIILAVCAPLAVARYRAG
jgi:ABC transporter DrrB family efflux protein